MTQTLFSEKTALKMPLWLNKKTFFGRVIMDIPLEKVEEERLRLQREREEQAILRENIAHAKYCAKLLPKACQEAGIAREYKVAQRKGNPFAQKYEIIRLGEMLISPDAYFIRIAKMPHGKLVDVDLNKPEVLREISSKINSNVSIEFIENARWFRIEAKYGRGRIPEEVGYSEALRELSDKDGHLVYVVGMGTNQKVVKLDLEQNPHIMLSGASGGGKSVHLHVLLCTLIQRNMPEQLRLGLTDLKGNALVDYQAIPHIGLNIMIILGPKEDEPEKPKKGEMPPILYKGRRMLRAEALDYQPKPGEEYTTEIGQTVITKPEDVVPVVYAMVLEMNRRNDMFGAVKPAIEDLAQWNAVKRDQQMPYILFVVDELFRLTVGKNKILANQFEWAIGEVVGTGRASGMRTIICTQSPTEKVVPMYLRHNFAAFLATRASNGPASGIALGDGSNDAANLPAKKLNGEELRGRMIIRKGPEKNEVQGPNIAKTTRAEIISKVVAGEFLDTRGAELAQKANFLFNVALDKLNGRCVKDDLYKFVQRDITLSEIDKILARWLYKSDNPSRSTISITGDSQLYYLLPGVKHRLCTPAIPPVLVSVNDLEQRKHPYTNYYGFFDEDFTHLLSVEEYALKSQSLRAEDKEAVIAAQAEAEKAKKAKEWEKALLLFRYALDNLNGKCAINELHQGVKLQRLSKGFITNCLNDYEVRGHYPDDLQPLLELRENEFYVLAPGDKIYSIARWLVPLDDFVAGRHPHADFAAYNEVKAYGVPTDEATTEGNRADKTADESENEVENG